MVKKSVSMLGYLLFGGEDQTVRMPVSFDFSFPLHLMHLKICSVCDDWLYACMTLQSMPELRSLSTITSLSYKGRRSACASRCTINPGGRRIDRCLQNFI
jgi:hypothetical protein